MTKKTILTWIAAFAAVGSVCGLLAAIQTDHPASAAASKTVSIYPDRTVPTTPAEDDPLAVELGVQFTVSKPGSLLGVKYYKSSRNGGAHVGNLWTAGGTRLATATFTGESTTGWQTVHFAQPVPLTPGTSYVASYHTADGYYAQQQRAFTGHATLGNSTIQATKGVYVYGRGGFPGDTWHDAAYYVDVVFLPSGAPYTPPPTTSAPPTTTTPAPPSTRTTRPTTTPTYSTPAPSTSNTTTPPRTSSTPTTASTPAPPPSSALPSGGVPAGTKLTPYTGPSTITKTGTVIDSADITKSLEIAAPNVVITKSRIHGSGDEGIHVSGSLTISDSTVSGFDNGIGGDNYTATRVELTALNDDGFKLGNNVHVDRAWCHDLSPSSEAHADCGQMQAGVVNMSVTNSWLVGGRNSALFLAPDLGPSSNGPVTISGNVLGNGNYSLYCVDGNNGEYFVKNITITNNRFMRDAQYGPATVNVPVTASNNVWYDTGTSIGGPLN
jgi:hypothetical protein